ncbi:hypothetical protein K435DRAFT_845246 [Dendrothele bispora CBS 962.96]|uniref:DUF6533 domain-containing protein n=1 Tax=Dendrothele bispora (strain CBS 962.96) TaxID=1314807 RepID=A0A4S8KW74_DENBC|nr:hypothetical protein K435DRAFT_845246 [Dendrothele bispora CBS 962.96]
MNEVSPWWVVAASIAPPIFLLYDHLLMLGMEIQYIWMKRKRRSAYWFFLLRYFVSTGEIVILVFRFWGADSQSRCLSFQMYIDAQTLLVGLLVLLLMSMRVYAIYERIDNKRVMWFMIAVAGILFPFVVWSVTMSSIGTVLLQGMICGRFYPEQRYDTFFGIMSAVHLANVILCATRVGFFLVSRFQDFVHYNSTITVIKYVSFGSRHLCRNGPPSHAQSSYICFRRPSRSIETNQSESHFDIRVSERELWVGVPASFTRHGSHDSQSERMSWKLTQRNSKPQNATSKTTVFRLRKFLRDGKIK